MAVEVSIPGVDELGEVVSTLRSWQHDDLPMQLHPGDLGWHWRFGAHRLAAALRIWRQAGHLTAIGFVDGPEVLRMTVAPEAWRDDRTARQLVADISDPRRGVLQAGQVSVEVPDGTRVQQLLSELGWAVGEAWTPLRRDLAVPVERTGLRIEVIEPGRESGFTAVHRSAWNSAAFTDDLWRTMAEGVPYADARCLLGYDDKGVAVAGVTVWSAGEGRPGLLEPMGVHSDHRRLGHGVAICVAAAAELEKLGASSAQVCTPSAQPGAVATYQAAGFRQLPVRLDRTRVA